MSKFGKQKFSSSMPLEGKYQNFDMGQSYRLQMWTSRVLLVLLVISSLVIIFLALALKSVLPLKEIQPFFIETKDQADQIVKVQAFEGDLKGAELLSEKMARKYLLKRETIDLQTEEERYEQVELFSNRFVFSEFKSLIESKNSFLKKAQQDRLTRSILIKHVSWISRTKKQIQIEYEMVDRNLDTIFDRRLMVATLSFTYDPLKVNWKERYINPVGFRVVDYTTVIKQEG